MFAYSPTPDRSGEILASGQMQAAQTNAQMMSQLGQDIGGALQAIGGIYAQGQQVKSDAKIYGDLIKFAAPVLGDDKGEMLKAYNEMNTRDQANFGRLLFGGGTFATMSQGYNFGQRLGVQQNQPFINTALDDMANTASGNRTFTPSGGGSNAGSGGGAPAPGPVLMDGADPDKPLPAVAGAPQPAATPRPGVQKMTREQWDAMNADLVRRGFPSRGPYPN